MIKEVKKESMVKFGIYPEMNMSLGTSGTPNLEELKSYINLYTNVPFDRNNEEYAVPFHKKYEKEGYLTPTDIIKFLETLEKEVQRIKEHSIINEKSEEIVFFKLTKDE